MKPTKEQKDEAIAQLTLPWGKVSMVCDGYEVTLMVRPRKALTYRVMTYVNGRFEGKWSFSDTAYPEQKFMRQMTRKLYSAAEVRKAEKVFGKRAVAKDPSYSKTYTVYHPDWSSGKAAISHLCKVCESVEIAKIGD